MPRKCAICASQLRTEIEKKIINNESTTGIAEWATQNGLKISHMVVQRHKPHIENYQPKDWRQPGIDAQDEIDSLDDEFQVTVPSFESGSELLEFARNTAQKILANHLAILLSKQEAYMAGRGRFPSAEFQALKTFVSCMNVLAGDIYRDDNSKSESTPQNDIVRIYLPDNGR